MERKSQKIRQGLFLEMGGNQGGFQMQPMAFSFGPEKPIKDFKGTLKRIIAYHDKGVIGDEAFSEMIRQLCAKLVEIEVQSRVDSFLEKKFDFTHFFKQLEF